MPTLTRIRISIGVTRNAALRTGERLTKVVYMLAAELLELLSREDVKRGIVFFSFVRSTVDLLVLAGFTASVRSNEPERVHPLKRAHQNPLAE